MNRLVIQIIGFEIFLYNIIMSNTVIQEDCSSFANILCTINYLLNSCTIMCINNKIRLNKNEETAEEEQEWRKLKAKSRLAMSVKCVVI